MTKTNEDIGSREKKMMNMIEFKCMKARAIKRVYLLLHSDRHSEDLARQKSEQSSRKEMEWQNITNE